MCRGKGFESSKGFRRTVALSALLMTCQAPVFADEQLFGHIKGAEPMPRGAMEVVGYATHRWDKGAGSYAATDYKLEVERGLTNRLTGALYLKGMGIDTSGLRIDGYMPADKKYAFKLSGVEASLKYAFLTPARDDIGIAAYLSFSKDWIDAHSGQDKDKYNLELKLLAQKYFLDGQVVWAANTGIGSTYAKRGAVTLPYPDFEWTTDPEMEIEYMVGTGLSYRFAPNWYIGAEVFYETEFETEVGQERWSVQAGPSLHYGARDWWFTLSWLPQISGGGEKFAAQNDQNLHLIEKTKQEVRLKVGFNF